MSKKLDAYLEEISHFLSGRKEREEILAEIRSHILEKAEREFGEVTEEALEKVIAAYGPARRVAEEYLEGRPIIAPAYRIDVVSNCVSLVLIGLLLRQPFDNLFAIKVPDWLLPKIKVGLTVLLLFIAVMITIELIRNLVFLGRKKLAK